MSFNLSKSEIKITCGRGIAPVLRNEVLSLGMPVLAEGHSYVSTEGTIRDAMRLNLFIRTGHRVLFLLKEVTAEGPDELYRELSAMEWEALLAEDGYVCVTSTVENRFIKDPRFANLKSKDAIVDRMMKRFGRRPDSGPERDRAVIAIYWKEDRCSVYLDTSGEPLSKRGYRKIPLRAPMQETLAAAVVLSTQWGGLGSFVNPMCGSGTLAIEAALIALNRAPGSFRRNFGFMHIRGYDETGWRSLLNDAAQGRKKEFSGRIVATDHFAAAVEAAQANAEAAGVRDIVEFAVCDYASTAIPEGNGTVILNPEYGERLGDETRLAAVYAGIGDFFKKQCKGYVGYVFTGNPSLAKRVGLKPKRKMIFFNGGIECRLLEYELYEGSKKRKYQAGGKDGQES